MTERMNGARRFEMVDVFADLPFTGNPLPVVVDAEGLDGGDMMRITRWMNQAETTFLLPAEDPGADYRVRIFTLERELSFAGHPTLGSCQIWLNQGGKPRRQEEIVQECGAGLIRIRSREGMPGFAAPPVIRSGPVSAEKRHEVVAVLGLDPEEVLAMEWADNGPGWVLVLLGSAERVLALDPAPHHPSRIDVGVVGPHAPDHEFDWEIRTFFSDQHGSLREDPVTGSFNASAAQWLLEQGRAETPWLARQGTRIGRAGRISIQGDGDTLWVHGRVISLIQGHFEGRLTEIPR